MGNPYQTGSAYGVSYPDGNGNGPAGFAWGALMLPYVEEQNLYDQFNFKAPCWAPESATAAQTKLPLFLCPSASGGDDTFSVDQYVGNPWGPDLIEPGTNPYSPPILLAHSPLRHQRRLPSAVGPRSGDRQFRSAGAGHRTGRAARRNVHRRGFLSQLAIGPKNFTDGLSNTVFIGEHSSILSDKTWVGVPPFSVSCPKYPLPPTATAAATWWACTAAPTRTTGRK